ncbi:TOTE conflict system archaeo-eukaryotic primase domain-containing protein [Propionivibrio limicola]|uniref:TOTE conflict system archaeo-eukaryotic primase domain-containing protein n=1 Tax=Propionivibrio limicola TaxID=167645 RepID=UPI0012916111|nr:hypothetical protein [Propionivibrio limicola]
MNKLTEELTRLYFLPEQQGLCLKQSIEESPIAALTVPISPSIVAENMAGEKAVVLDLVSARGTVKTMVVSFEKATDWKHVARFYQAIQENLELPAPAVSVSCGKGYQVWLSLAEPIAVAEAWSFQESLRRHYFADLPEANLKFYPGVEASSRLLQLAPARHPENGKWSAFIDPTLGDMFIDEPWLEMAPNFDKQAAILADLESIRSDDFRRALDFLQPVAEAGSSLSEETAISHGGELTRPAVTASASCSTLNVGSNFSDPKSFLMAVMNDPSADADNRIKAAKALLPYFEAKPEPSR